MSRWATLTVLAALGFYLMQGPRAAPIPAQTDWAGLFASPHLAPALALVSTGESPAQKSGADRGQADGEQHQPDTVSRAASPQPAAKASSSGEEAEYRARREECESLPGDARNHCIEYVKLRFGHS